jgi:hypothetical protein
MKKLLQSRWVLGLMVLCLAPAAFGEIIPEDKSARHGMMAEIATASCIYEPPGKNAGTTLEKDKQPMALRFQPDPLQTGTAVLYAYLGEKLDADQVHCTNPVEKKYVVHIDDAQQVSDGALSTVFPVLVAALALAILLESAFELLFNWRLFQEFFVGKAWRTPIMFVISLIVVSKFKFDVLGPVFDAYKGQPANTSNGGVLGFVLSAMIIAGGSVGVNRLMTKLGIRSPFPKVDEERAMLNDTEAYVSVTVVRQGRETPFAVNLSEEPADPNVPAILGVVNAARPDWPRSLLFPNKRRVPRSGGFRVAVNKTYRLSVTDILTGDLYDIGGKKVEKQTDAAPVRFAPRAFVDLVVVLKPLGSS